jgi:hypothetical protein
MWLLVCFVLVRARLRPGACAVSGHTPEEWKLRTEHHGATDKHDFVIYTDEREVVRVRGKGLDIRDFMLMKAAPDMLQELKEVRDWFRAEYSRDDSPEGMFVGTAVEKDVASIDCTIANAEGRP